MSKSPAHTTVATPDEMSALWESVLKQLLGKLSGTKKGSAAAELLQVARGFLKDSSYVSPKVNNKATQRQLERLQRLYQERLLAELANGSPSVGLLTEARLFRQQLEQQMALEAGAAVAAGSSQLQSIPISTPFQ